MPISLLTRFTAIFGVATMNCEILNKSYRKLLGSLGHSIGAHPFPFLLLPPLLVGALLYPFVTELRRYSHSEEDLDIFWPIGSRSVRDKNAISREFPDGDRSILTPTLFIVLISSKDFGSVLRQPIVDAYSSLLQDLTSLSVNDSTGVSYNYSRLCLTDSATGKCPTDLFLSIWNAQLSNQLKKLTYPTLIDNADRRPIYLGSTFGGVITDGTGEIRFAKHIRVELKISTGGFHDVLLKPFAVKFNSFMNVFRSDVINVDYWSAVSFKEDFDRVRWRILRFSPILLAVVIIFPIATAFTGDWVTSKPWLALSGVISALLGMAVAFSFLFLCKVPLIDLALLIPFLILPAAIDQTFLITNVWRETCRCLSVSDRMQIAYSKSAISITVTTVINFTVFAVGAFSPFPIVRTFCLLTAMSSFVAFLFQLSFFGSCLSLTGRREEANRHCLTFRKTTNTQHTGDTHKITLSRSESEDTVAPWPVIFFRDYYAPLLGKTSVRVTVALAYLVFITFSIWVSLTQLSLGLQLSKLLPYDSATFRFLTAQESFFTRCRPNSVELVIPGRLDYSDLDVRTKLLKFVRSLEYSDFTLNAEFWLRDFLAYSQSSTAIVSPQNFLRFLQNGFLQAIPYKQYQTSINMVTDPEGNSIISSSRFYLHLINTGGNNYSKAMEFLRKRIDKDSPVPMWIYEVSLPLAEQNDLIALDILQNLGFGAICILLISGLFSPYLLSTICIGFTILSSAIGVIAGYAMWDVQLDIFTIVGLLLSLATSVSSAVHLSNHYTMATEEFPLAKVQSSLTTVGWPILQTSLLSILAVIPLVATGTYVGFAVVKTVLLVAILSLFHSLLVLPVLLISADEFLRFVLGKQKTTTEAVED